MSSFQTPVVAPRTYFVTGASSGIGLSMVRRLKIGGAMVIGTGRRAASDLPADFPDIAYIPADLRRPGDIEALLAAVPERLDRAILMAGTGFTGRLRTRHKVTLSTW